MKMNEFLIRELHQDRHLTSEVDQLFAEREVKKGELLVREGSHTDRVLFFEQGIAREYIIADGVEVTNYFHLESTFYIPLASIFLGKEVGSNVEMEEDGVVRVAPYHTLERLMAGNLSAQRFTFQMYSMAILRMYEISHSLQSCSASDRYEHLLREQPDIVQRVPLGHIVSYLGITQQRLSVIRRQVKL